jgi:hypothetical protein
MYLTQLSERRLKKSFLEWEVDDEYSHPIYNYLVFGYSPGGFFTSVLANDFMTAMSRSHPGNTVTALKKIAGWIYNSMPPESWGNYDTVESWTKLSADERRAVLERRGLVFTPKEETWLSLKEEVL